MWLLAVQGQALIFNAAAEIGAGFLLLLGLLTPQRSIVLAFVYWRTFLPTRYNTPDAAGYHRQVSNVEWSSPSLQQVNACCSHHMPAAGFCDAPTTMPFNVSTSLAC